MKYDKYSYHIFSSKSTLGLGEYTIVYSMPSHWVRTIEFNPLPISKKPLFFPNYSKMAAAVLSEGCPKYWKVERLWKVVKGCGKAW